MKKNQIIVDRLENAEKYYTLHPAFEKAFLFLKQKNLKDLPMGRQDLDGNRLYVMISKSPGRKRENVNLEAHRKYIDIQYIVSGTDEMGWRQTDSCTLLAIPYDADKDIMFYRDEPVSRTPVTAGSFTIFFPNDAHAPLIGDGEIYKVVIKVAVE